MNEFSQGDIIKISGFKNKFIIVSKNSFIKATNVFHVCPMIENLSEGPLHIFVTGRNAESGTVICEQIKLIDPGARTCNRIDSIPYHMIMNISDAIQGVFEYD
jgi:mRNA interferase MazF